MKRRKKGHRSPYYLVCGMPRGGTSMMMQALIEGGMAAHYVDNHEQIKKDAARGFQSNPRDSYEWEKLPNRLPSTLRGKVIKVFPWHIWDLRPGLFKILLITRDEESLRASMDTYIRFAEETYGEGMVNREVLQGRRIVANNNIKDLYDAVELALSHHRLVKDVTKVEYGEVCENPTETFEYIKECGWPVDVAKAAAVPNRNWRNV